MAKFDSKSKLMLIKALAASAAASRPHQSTAELHRNATPNSRAEAKRIHIGAAYIMWRSQLQRIRAYQDQDRSRPQHPRKPQ